MVTILGRVTAHEIGHLLIGTNSHAPSGLMRASWNVKVAASRPSGSSPRDDASKIRVRLLARSEDEVAAAQALDE